MSKASAHLAISHPVISKTISDLEHTLGVRLFDRNSQGVELTTYGRTLLNCGVTVFDEMRQGLKQIEFLADPKSGELRIGCPEILMAGLLPAIMERFSRLYPQIRLHVLHANTALLQFEELRQRNVDLLLGRMPRPFLEDDLVAEILFDEPFVAVAGAHSRWARRRRLEFRASNLRPPRASMVTLAVQLTTNLIATGHYVGLLPRSAAQFSGSRDGLKILPVKLADQRTAVGVITVKNRTLSPLAELFIDCARQVVKPLAERK